MYKIEYEDGVIEDLNNIYSFISGDNDYYALKVILHITKTIDYLESFPFIGTNIGNGMMRLVDTKYKYNIIYRINGNIIEIVSVFKYKNF